MTYSTPQPESVKRLTFHIEEHRIPFTFTDIFILHGNIKCQNLTIDAQLYRREKFVF